MNDNGDTPLHICAISGSLNSLMLIIDKASQEENEELLKDVVNLQNKQGNTALHACMLKSNTEKARGRSIYEKLR